jgi:hypothetical protein
MTLNFGSLYHCRQTLFQKVLKLKRCSLYLSNSRFVTFDFRFVAEIEVLTAAALPYSTLGVGRGGGRQVSLRVLLSSVHARGEEG